MLLFQALDDDMAEERRVYQLTLTSVTPGAEISPSAQRATVTMAASDLPYGLFSFPQGLVGASEEEGKVREPGQSRAMIKSIHSAEMH